MVQQEIHEMKRIFRKTQTIDSEVPNSYIYKEADEEIMRHKRQITFLKWTSVNLNKQNTSMIFLTNDLKVCVHMNIHVYSMQSQQSYQHTEDH